MVKTKPAKISKKFDKVKRFFDVDIYKKSHPVIKALNEHAAVPVIHGHKVWDSSLLIMDYLEKKPLEPKQRVMELGCGWGLLSIYCAKHHKAKVTSVDADPNVFPYLIVHENLNKVSVRHAIERFEDLSTARLGKQDLILGADICFWDELTEALFTAIKKAMKGGARKIIIADPGRDPFFDLVKKCKKKL